MNPANAKFVCGAECGIAVVGTASAGIEHWSSTSGTAPTVVTSGPSTMRSIRCFAANGAAGSKLVHTFATAIGSPATVVARFYMNFGAALPAANTVLFEPDGLSSNRGPWFDVSDGKIYAGSGSEAYGASGISVTTDTWYRIDCKVVRDTTTTIDVRVDGVACGQRSLAGSASAVTAFAVGHGLADATKTIYYDDIVVSGTSAEYPIGEGSVFGAYPVADGTHSFSTVGDFGKGAGGATTFASSDTTVWQSLDNPLVATAAGSWVADLLGANTEYVEFAMDDLPADALTVNGVMLVVTTHSATATTNDFNIQYQVGAPGDAVRRTISGPIDLSESTITIPIWIIGQADSPAGAGSIPWTPSAINATEISFGQSADVNPDVYLDGVCLEVDVVRADALVPYASPYPQMIGR